MAGNDDLEDLDAELARLEAELAALEGDESPKGKGKRKSSSDASDDAGSGLKGLASKLPGKLPFKRSDDSDDDSDADDAKDDAEDAPEESGGGLRDRFKGLPSLRNRKDDAEAPTPTAQEAPKGRSAEPPEGFDPRAEWGHEGARWRRQGTPPDGGEVVLRRMDLEGNVVEEGPTDDPDVLRLVEDDSQQEGLRGRLGLGGLSFGRRDRDGDDGDTEPEGDEANDGKGRRRIIIPLVAVLALLVAAILLPALAGVDPTGLGARMGLGGGADAIQPALTVTPEAAVAAVGDQVTFDASATTDERGRDLTYTWNFDDGSPTVKGARVSHTYQAPGDYTVTLTVTAGGASTQATQDVTILAKPVADLAIQVGGADASASNPIFAGEAVTLTAAGSTSEDPITSYQWAVDGATYTGESATHTFAEPGMYTVTLTLTTEQGLTATSSAMVHAGWTGLFNDTAPQSVGGASSGPAHAFPVGIDGSMAPARVVLTLTYEAPQALPTGDTSPGGELSVDVADADGNLAANATGTGGEATIELTSFSGLTLGDWTATVKRAQGGAQDKGYELTVSVVYPPLMEM